MNGRTGQVAEACDPYPWRITPTDIPDNRRSNALAKVINGLSEDELRDMVRSFSIRDRRGFEQQLCFVQEVRRLRESLRGSA